MKKSVFKTIVFVFTALFFLIALAGCKDKTVKDVTFNTSSIQSEYTIDADVNFDNVSVTVVYKSEREEVIAISNVSISFDGANITLSELKEKVTKQLGNHTIVFSYLEHTCTVNYTVKAKSENPGDVTQLISFDAFGISSNYSTYEALLNSYKNNDEYGDDNFEGSLYVYDDNMYVVGNDNAFKFLPLLNSVDIVSGIETVYSEFKTLTKFYLSNGTSFDELTRTVSEDGKYVYFKANDKLYVTEEVGKNLYKFDDDNTDNVVLKISVLPDSNVFDVDSETKAVEFTFKIVDGYNVTNEKELCILEQSGTNVTTSIEGNKIYMPNHGTSDIPAVWAEFKAELGLTDVRPSSVVLHKNMKLDYTSIPTTMYYTMKDTVLFTDGEKDYTAKEAGFPIIVLEGYENIDRKNLTVDQYVVPYLWFTEGVESSIYQFDLLDNEEFTIHGNYYNIDCSNLPRSCSFTLTGAKASDYVSDGDTWYSSTYVRRQYRQYCSTQSLLQVAGKSKYLVTATRTDDTHATLSYLEPDALTNNHEKFYFSNFIAVCNAPVENYYVKDEQEGVSIQENGISQVAAGGLIFAKFRNVSAYMTNINVKNSFISFYTRQHSYATYKDCKSFDCFQNALYANSYSVSNLDNCTFERCGGPLILCNESSKEQIELNIGHFKALWNNQNIEFSNSESYYSIPEIYATADCHLHSFVTANTAWYAMQGMSTYMGMFDLMNEGITSYTGRMDYKKNKTLNATCIKTNVKEESCFDNLFVCVGNYAIFKYGDANNNKVNLSITPGSNVLTEVSYFTAMEQLGDNPSLDQMAPPCIVTNEGVNGRTIGINPTGTVASGMPGASSAFIPGPSIKTSVGTYLKENELEPTWEFNFEMANTIQAQDYLSLDVRIPRFGNLIIVMDAYKTTYVPQQQ